MRGVWVAAAALLLVLSGCMQETDQDDERDEAPAGPAQDHDAAPFAMEGRDCAELLVMASVPVETARPHVPSDYTLFGAASGSATVFATLKSCQDLSLDGRTIGGGTTSDTGVFIESPDGSDGFHYYQTWWHTDNAALRARLDVQGWPGLQVNDTVLQARSLPGGAVLATSFVVPDPNGTYGGAADVIVAEAPVDNLATGWHEGPAGTIKVVKRLLGTTTGTGHGTLSAEGGPLAALMGGGSASGPALWSVYAMDGTVGAAE